jgi:adenine-specific DNA-methyltransferase
MAKRVVEYVTKTTPDVTADQVARLREIFPECVTEGRVDFERLRATLGDLDALSGEETYSFTWAGRADAFRAIQTPSAASLRPAPDESVNWDTTQHLFIEGENLEVLKLLYKSYYGRVKMIYIDPPYNTGNDFIYRDDYSQPRRAYLEKTGQVDAEGNVLTSNPEASGRYHSDWLTMMYPRLFLARQFLREDGVIFVSIDDHEVHHLRLLMNEVFGEENFIASVIWQKVYSPKNTAMYFSEDHDYVLVYARNAELWRPNLLPRTDESNARYGNPDNDERGPWKSGDMTARNYYSEGQYEVISPSGNRFRPPRGRYWVVNKERFLELDRDNRIWWGQTGENVPALKRFLSEVKQGIVPQTLWKYEDVGHTQDAKKELLSSVSFEHTENVLNTVKPPRLIQRMLQIATDPSGGDLVIDFFAASASTAHAVLQENREDGGNRHYIMVQLAEPLPIPESHLNTIADIGKERIRRVISQMQAEREGQLPLETRNVPEDLGFRVFKLAPSTFRQWEQPDEDAGALAQQLTYFDRGLEEGVDPQHVLYEVILKEGYPLTSRIETFPLDTNRIYRITDTRQEDNPLCFYLCLDAEVCTGTLDALPLDKETIFICLDSALDDSRKVNLAQQCLLKVL